MLIVEADSNLCGRWSVALESSGHSVLVAQRTTDGIYRVREGGIDLILLDPGEGYGQLDQFLVALSRLPDPPPFVLLSSSPRAPEVSAHVGAAAFLPMPCTEEDILDIAERFAMVPVHQPVADDEPTEPRGEIFRVFSN